MLGCYLPPALQSTHRASLWLFPLVSLYAALIMPLTFYAFNYPDGLPGLADRTGHAYEMFFGIGLGLVAGYLSGTVRCDVMLLLAGGWVMGRVTHLWMPWSWLSLLTQTVFCLVLLVVLVPKLNVAKRWRTRMMVPLLLALGLIPLVTVLSGVTSSPWVLHDKLAGVSLLLFSLLMMYIGGRAIAPAAAGAHYRLGRDLQARVQPEIEGPLIIILALAAFSRPFDYLPVTGLLAMTAGVLVLIRLYRWQLWLILRRVDVICLSLGYAWLGVGLIVLGINLAFGWRVTAAMHLITIGAIGTLSTGMMARVVLQRTVKQPPPPMGLMIIAACIGFSAITRFSADLVQPELRALWLQLSVVGWSTAYAALSVWLVAAITHPRQRIETRVKF